MISRTAQLDRALTARRVAIFGASATPGKWGYVVVERLLDQGFNGEVVLVNPRGGTAFGLPLVEDTEAAGADLAVAVTPAATIPGILDRCGDLDIGALVVESAGFAEAGDRELELEIAQRAESTGVRVIGPNCLGLFVAPSALNVTTLPQLPAGAVSFISQSGGLALQIARRLRQLGGGFDVLASLGNAVDVGFEEVLRAVGQRPTTQAVLMYLERMDGGEALLDRIALLADFLPVVIMLGGRTAPGRDAARSHTASMLTSWDRVAGVLRDAGALVMDSIPLATAAAVGGVRSKRRRRRRVLAVVDGGGHSVMLADALVTEGFDLAAPPVELAEKLAADGRPASNPLDLAGAADGDPALFARTLSLVLESSFYDAVILGGIFGGYSELFGRHLEPAEVAAASEIGRLALEHDTPVVLQTTFACQPSAALDAARSRAVTCVEWPDEAVSVLRCRERRTPGETASPPRPVTQPWKVDPDLGELTSRVLTVFDANGIGHGIGNLVERSELPVSSNLVWVLRLDGFIHKARDGAIRLGLPASELPRSYDELSALAHDSGIEPRIRLAPLVQIGDELLVSFWRHREEGSGWLVGSGGVGVEALRDLAAARPPRNEDDVLRLVSATRLGRSLVESGALGGLPAFLMRLALTFDEQLSDLTELECNPVALTSDGPLVLDVLATA